MKNEQDSTKNRVLKAYTTFVKKQGRHPTTSEMLELGVTRNTIRHHYGSISNLKEMAKDTFPKVFDNIIDSSYFTEEKFQQLLSEVKKYKKFVITTAVVGCSVHRKFLSSIELYCKRNNALLLILPSADPAKSSDWVLDGIIAEKDIQLVFKNIQLNTNFFVSSIKISAKQLNPMTGLNRFGSKEGSFVFASPKQDLQFVPKSHTKLPHALMTTGALTIPDYETDSYMSERTGYIAKSDHIMGALVVEIENDKNYHFRQIQAEPVSGNFVDLGIYYKSNGKVGRMDAEALVMGDYHSGETDPTAKKAWEEVVHETKARDLVIHDMFNGKSITYHDRHKKVKMAIKFDRGLLSLKEETLIVGKEVGDLYSWVKPRKGRLIWVRSNHDDFLEKLLEDGSWVEDPINMVICASLVKPMSEGKDPLKTLLESEGKVDPYTSSRIIWLGRSDDYKIAGHQCAAHGDKGAHGKRNPTLEELDKAYGSCVTGHSHTPAIRRGAFRVGTSSYLRLDYNDGASAWFHTSCLIYPNGSRQLINSVNGKWKL